MNKLKRIVCTDKDGKKTEYIDKSIFKDGSEKKVEKNHKFDWCIKQTFLNQEPYITGHKLKNKHCFGFYISKYNTIYDRYFSPDMKLEELLSEEIRECYAPTKTKKTTSGNEFSSGKFYSVASSSRLAVSSFTKEINGKLGYIESIKIEGKDSVISQIEFEHDTPIAGIPKGQHCPQLDVFMKTEMGTVFVEVKNHEILDSHKNIELSWTYAEKAEVFDSFGLNRDDIKSKLVTKKENGKVKKYNFVSINDKFLTASDFGCNLNSFHFDFKQFLCHLMGILSYAKEHQDEEIYFYYLVYKNELYVKEYKAKLYEELEAEVKVIFEVFRKKISEEFPKIHFGLCYNDKYDTLTKFKLAEI